MPKLEIQVEETALKEIQDAYEWYESKSKKLGRKFLLALDASFNQIQKSP